MFFWRTPGIVFALLAALVWGVSTPLSKILLTTISPILLAAILYLTDGVALLAWLGIARWRHRVPAEAWLKGRDWGWLAGATLAGGVLGPVLLLWGLARCGAASASLLLNSEMGLSALLAWVVFREHVSKRSGLGMLAIAAGGGVLSWGGSFELAGGWGPLAIVAGCGCWAVDNNLTREISRCDPFLTGGLKGLVAGTFRI